MSGAARPRYLAWSAVALLLLAGIALAGVTSLRWRTEVILLTATGKIPDLELADTISLLLPGSGQSIARMIETRNPYSVIHNPRVSPADIAAGAQLFSTDCAACHGVGGAGKMAPALTRGEFAHGSSDWALFRNIRYGVARTAMPPHPLPRNDLWQLVGYVRSLEISRQDPPGYQPAVKAMRPLSYDELRATREPSADWLTYSGSYSATRHSLLGDVTPENVERIAVRWIYQLPGRPDIRATPIVRDGVLFMTLQNSSVLAIDAATGELIWSHEGSSGPYNRGVAILDDRVFVGMSDGRLQALSAQTGKLLWETAVTKPADGFILGAAPLAYRDLVVTGMAMGGGQGRGIIAAFDAKTGKERWRFTTIPGAGEHGNESWSGDSWRTGGAPTWMTGSYDPEQDLLYWGVGNPVPDYDAAARKGDNLYSNSVVALRGATGELAWHFQFTPGDNHDWDANQIPVLADQGRLLWANRNGFFYVLERSSGKFLGATPFVQQTWAKGIDARGRPVLNTATTQDVKGIVTYPGNIGATNWWSPSFDAALNLFFVPVLEQGMIFFRGREGFPVSNGRSFYTAVRALDASSGKQVWEYRREPRTDNPAIGGLLSTRSGLVFGSDQGNFFALDARSGKLLWSIETGGTISAGPITYSSDGEQFIAITSGGNLLAFALPGQESATAR